MEAAARPSGFNGLRQAFSSQTSRVEVPAGPIMTAAFGLRFRGAPTVRFRAFLRVFGPTDEGFGSCAVGVPPKGGFLDLLLVSMDKSMSAQLLHNLKMRSFEQPDGLSVLPSGQKRPPEAKISPSKSLDAVGCQ
jgi:hypothetical protein